jgi:hypothetical protein
MRSFPILAAMLLASLPVMAQDHNHPAAGAQPAAPQQGGGMMMQGGDMGGTMGMHMMTVTVTALDGKSGLVDGTAGGMALKLHFPPPSLAGVKAGDKLMVHLSFHKV